MSALALPLSPANLRGQGMMKMIDSDVYHICERVRELDPNLYVYVLDPPQRVGDRLFHFAVCEQCVDGVERLVNRYDALDARIINDLEYMLRVPFEHRFAEAEKREAEADAKRKDDELMELYDRMGRPMWTQLEHDGFSQRSISFPKRGVRRR